MLNRKMLAITALSALTALAQPVFSQTDPAALPDMQAQWVSIPQVLERLEAEGYGNVEKIERENERHAYEVKASDRNGRRLEFYVDGATGEVLPGKPARLRRDD